MIWVIPPLFPFNLVPHPKIKVAHAYKPRTLGGQGEQMAWAQEFEISLGNIVRLPSLQKIQRKLAGFGVVCLWSQLLRRLRREDGLNPGGQGCSELRWHHCTTSCRTVRPCLKKNFNFLKKSKDLNISLEKIYEWQKAHEKMLKSLSGNCLLKPQ